MYVVYDQRNFKIYGRFVTFDEAFIWATNNMPETQNPWQTYWYVMVVEDVARNAS